MSRRLQESGVFYNNFLTATNESFHSLSEFHTKIEMKRWLCPRTKMLTYFWELSFLCPGSLSSSSRRNGMTIGLGFGFEVTYYGQMLA